MSRLGERSPDCSDDIELTEQPIPLHPVFSCNSFSELLDGCRDEVRSQHSANAESELEVEAQSERHETDGVALPTPEPHSDGDNDDPDSDTGLPPFDSQRSKTKIVSNQDLNPRFEEFEMAAKQLSTSFKPWDFLVPKLPTFPSMDQSMLWTEKWDAFDVPQVGIIPVPHLSSTSSNTAPSGGVRQLGPARNPQPWSLHLKADREKALSKWGLLIEDGLEHTVAGKQLLELKKTACDERTFSCMINDILQSKSTSTLHSRADSLILFSRWKQLHKDGSTLFPIFESEAYDYLCSLRASSKPPTRASRFLEAVHFAGGVLGFDLEPFRSSARLGGVIKSIATFRRERVKRDPLTRQQVLLLEIALLSHQLPSVELVFIGFILFLIFTRCRFSDSKYCVDEPKLDLDSNNCGYIEASLYDHKTANTSSKRFRLLPVVGPAIGISGECWARAYLKARKTLCLTASRSSPLMPALSMSGYVNGTAMSVQEANIFLCDILNKIGAPKLPNQVIGTHSCKATLLSWLAKASVNETHRRLLGYHAAPGEHVMLEYSRDSLAGPLNSLVAVLKCIQLNKFKPDETRSGRWQIGCSLDFDGVELVSTPDLDEQYEDPEMGLTDGSIESHTSADSVTEVDQACTGLSLRSMGPASGSHEVFKHNVTGTFHRRGFENSLACGRKLATCSKIDENTQVLFPKCKVCFGNMSQEL